MCSTSSDDSDKSGGMLLGSSGGPPPPPQPPAGFGQLATGLPPNLPFRQPFFFPPAHLHLLSRELQAVGGGGAGGGGVFGLPPLASLPSQSSHSTSHFLVDESADTSRCGSPPTSPPRSHTTSPAADADQPPTTAITPSSFPALLVKVRALQTGIAAEGPGFRPLVAAAPTAAGQPQKPLTLRFSPDLRSV